MPERGFYGMGRSNRAIRNVSFVLDGGGSLLTTGDKLWVPVDFGFLLEGVTLLADLSGSVVIDVLASTYANYSTGFASICGGAKPTITSALKSRDLVLAGWTRAVLPGAVLKFNVNSVTSITKVVLSFKISLLP